MKSNKLTNQGGSVATFVVVGIVLAAFVFGGVYLLQKRNSDGSKSGPVAVNTSSPAPSGAPAGKGGEAVQPTSTPAASKSPVVTPAPSKTPAAPSASSIPTTASLPQTGPGEDFAGTVMLAIFTGTAVAYLRSHRIRHGYRTE